MEHLCALTESFRDELVIPSFSAKNHGVYKRLRTVAHLRTSIFHIVLEWFLDNKKLVAANKFPDTWKQG